jgi:uncharacterized protein (TIGR00255 family)
MKSMTGFGRAEARAGGRTLQVQISSVNSRKGLDLQINLPRELAALESSVRAQVQEALSRGRVTVEVACRTADNASGPELRIDVARLKAARRQVLAAARAAGVTGEVSLEFLLRLPGVISESTPEADAATLAPTLTATVAKALESFQKSRAREGAFLCRDLKSKFAAIGKLVAAVAARKEGHTARYREALARRLKEAGLELPLDEERLARELALFADRSDISEELTRLAAHLEEARRLLTTATAIGRNLDFLLQEIGREINTIGSKANDLEISRRVVAMKTELEKIREQAQNLE